MVVRLAKGVMALDEEIAELDALIEARFREHPHAEVILSLPGIGAKLGAEFLAATGGDMDAFGSPDRLAGFAGLAPRPRDNVLSDFSDQATVIAKMCRAGTPLVRPSLTFGSTTECSSLSSSSTPKV